MHFLTLIFSRTRPHITVRRGKPAGWRNRRALELADVSRLPLHGQVELLALHDLGPVDVEEVGVQDGLDQAGHDGDRVEVAFRGVPVWWIVSGRILVF